MPAPTTTALALVRPSNEFKVEAKGCGCPLGQMVRNPRAPCGTTVTLSEYAAALFGMLQALCGMRNSREVPPLIDGPPKFPGGLRVSATRHGGTETNCSAG